MITVGTELLLHAVKIPFNKKNHEAVKLADTLALLFHAYIRMENVVNT